MKRIGMFGGSFNPFHNGHINCVIKAKKVLNLDLVLVVPNYKHPLKPMIQKPTPEQRLSMAELSCKDYDFIHVDDREIRRKGDSFTALTLKELAKIYNEIYLIMGADLFQIFPNWDMHDEVVKIAKVAVSTRPGFKIKKSSDITLLQLNDIDISASKIREWITKNDKRIYDFMNRNAVEYILDNRLYIASDPLSKPLP